MGVTESELAAMLGRPVDSLQRLSGGASMETWSFTAGSRRLVLRMSREGNRMTGVGPAVEARVLAVAADAGVPVPQVLTSGDDYLIAEFVEGTTIPRKLLRDNEFAAARPRVVRQVAEAMARIHQVPASAVTFLDRPCGVAAQIEELAATLVELDDPAPALELGVRWLLRNLPPPRSPVLVHGDLRTGNLIIGPAGLRAVLDWELAHTGDPVEDLGWFCVRAWRFGVDDKPAGGFGTREELVAAYTAAGGVPVTPAELHFWEVFGTLKWGVICMAQAATHLRGHTRSVELATIGRRVAETEYDLLALLAERSEGAGAVWTEERAQARSAEHATREDGA